MVITRDSLGLGLEFCVQDDGCETLNTLAPANISEVVSTW